MSWIVLLGFLLGIVMGLTFKVPLPPIYGRYLGIAILAALDSVVGGIRSLYEKNFNERLFIAGFFTNSLLATFITFLGDRVGVDLALAAIVAFGVRMFQNLTLIRRYIFQSRRWE